MDPNSTTKRARIFGKLASTLVGALGLYVIGAMLLSVWRMFHSDESIWEMLFTFVFAVIVSAVGVLGVAVGEKLISVFKGAG